MSRRILILDTYYPEFIRVAPLVGLGSYELELSALMCRCFGTYDCYSRGLGMLGWETEDIVWNHTGLNQLRHRAYWKDDFDTVFCQDLQLAKPELKGHYVMAGQISCAWPGDEIISRFDILFTSFPRYVDRIAALGVRAVYLPLAFDPIVIERLAIVHGPNHPMPRKIGCSFVGGLTPQFGERHNLISHVEAHVPEFRTFGYGRTNQVPAWGLDMYMVYGCSKIVLNHHHPAAQGYSNNLRMFESTGMGAMLLTEASPNITEYFDPGVECMVYDSPEEAVELIRYFLDHDDERAAIAAAGQARTLRDHTYTQRMPIVDRELRAMLESKKGKAAS